MKNDLERLSLEIAATRRLIANQIKLVLQLESEGQSDLAELAQQQLEGLLSELERLKEVRRTVVNRLRLPKASAHAQGPPQRKRSGAR